MAFKRVVTSDPHLQAIQDNVQAALGSPASILGVTLDSTGKQKISKTTGANPFSSGNVITMALKSGQDNLVPHSLQATPQAWSVLRKDANANVWEVKTAQILDSNKNQLSANAQYLNLWCSANCNVTVWVA